MNTSCLHGITNAYLYQVILLLVLIWNWRLFKTSEIILISNYCNDTLRVVQMMNFSRSGGGQWLCRRLLILWLDFKITLLGLVNLASIINLYISCSGRTCYKQQHVLWTWTHPLFVCFMAQTDEGDDERDCICSYLDLIWERFCSRSIS